MNRLFAIAARLQALCDAHGWASCVIGGLAVQRWGEPRVTRDVDLVLLTGFAHEADFVDTLLAGYSPRISDAREFALKHRVLLIQTPDPVGIDISLGALPFEEQMISRATTFLVGDGFELRTCSAEDLVVLKVFASRPLDLRDAESVIIRHKERLDWHYIEEQLTGLAALKEDPEILRTLNRLRLIT